MGVGVGVAGEEADRARNFIVEAAGMARGMRRVGMCAKETGTVEVEIVVVIGTGIRTETGTETETGV